LEEGHHSKTALAFDESRYLAQTLMIASFRGLGS
jgi:hypothetical protein